MTVKLRPGQAAEHRLSLPVSPEAPTRERDAGIELFRSVAMILVLILHVINFGGAVSGVRTCSAAYYAFWFLKAFAYCCVDCFALITGYVNSAGEFRFKKLFLMWLDVVLLLAGTALIYPLFVPEAVPTKEVWLGAFFPLTTKELWYFNAYALLMPFIPVLNRGLEGMSAGKHRELLILLFLFTTVMHIPNAGDGFALGSGYSAIWLIILYVFGAYFRLHGIPGLLRHRSVCLAAALLCSSLSFWLQMHRNRMVYLKKITADSYEAKVLDRFVSYISPLTVLTALFLLLFFAGLRIRGRVSRRIICLLGEGSFGVYVFHVGSIMWHHFLPDRYRGMATENGLLLCLRIIGVSVLLYLQFSFVSVGEKKLTQCLRRLIRRLSAARAP